MAKEEADQIGHGELDYTEDGTVDLKGRPVLRTTTGRWRACSFIVVYEVFEKLAYQGIASNLVLYLTREFHQGTVTASNNVTNWIGSIWMIPILGAFIADAYLGRFRTFLISSAIYLAGMILLTLSVSVQPLKRQSCSDEKRENCTTRASSLQVGLFFAALYIIAIGNGGTKPNISTLGAEQFDEFEPKEKALKLSFFNWWVFSVFVGFLISETFVVYVQDNVGWSLGYGLPTAGLALSILVFVVGTPFYRHRVPSGSPFTKMAKVFVAAFRKWKVSLPDDPKELHELNLEDYVNSGINKIEHTSSLRFLDKAAVKMRSNSTTAPTNTRWALSTVTQVEETKKIVKLLPILLATFIPAIISAQSHTLFVKQAATLNRRLGPHFVVPPASLAVVTTLSLMVSLIAYDRFLTPNPKMTQLRRLGAGLGLHVAVSAAACLAERKRLAAATATAGSGTHTAVPLSALILVPQFALTGIADTFLEVAKQEFFYGQAPESMKSIGASLYCTGRGVGSFLGSVALAAAGGGGWVKNDLNESRLDYYYALLCGLASLNLVFFLVISKWYVYNVQVKRLLPVRDI